MATITQQRRLLEAETPLGKDVLLVHAFSGLERISGLFNFELALLADLPSASEVDPDKLIGKKVTVTVALNDDYENAERRPFNGIVSRFSQGHRDYEFAHYRLELVPWLWLLTLTSNCRIFQDLSSLEIIKKIFDELKQDYPDLVDYRDATTDSYTKMDYCVQYRETSYNFISRLAEQDGIFYFFEHGDDKHTLVLADGLDACPKLPNEPTLRYQPEAGMGEWEARVTSWQEDREMRPGKYSHRDYHFQMPSKTLEVSADTTFQVGGNDKLEVYDSPGEYAQRFNKPEERLGDVESEGQTLVDKQMEREETPSVVANGSTTCRDVTSGFQFELTEHFDSEANGAYVLTAIQHSATQEAYYRTEGGTAAASDSVYDNSISCVKLDTPFRPPRDTPKPVVHGMQTAVVVGPQGEEIFTDKYGRVKVQFHWDREGEKNQDSSCWIRVAQSWAGKRWGASYWPRIGQEVVVGFVDGDPDHPLIVGSVYNAEQMPPYLGDGPDGKHDNDPKITGVKSNSTPGGEGFNEWRFDDTKDKEQIFIHAERNMDTRVKNDSLARIYGNRHQIIGWEKDGEKGGDQREMIYQDRHQKVHRNHVEHIGGNMELLIGDIDGGEGNQDIVLKGYKKELIEKDSHLHVKSNRNENIDGGQSLTVGGDQQEKIGMKHAVEAGQEIHLKAGMKVIIEAGMQLTIKGPGGFVDIGPAGVTIQGILVKINSGGAAGSGSGSSPASAEDAAEAAPTEPSMADNAETGFKSAPD